MSEVRPDATPEPTALMVRLAAGFLLTPPIALAERANGPLLAKTGRLS